MAGDRSKRTTTPSPNRSEADALNWQQARSLLPLTGVIRDPVHGDIRITSLERVIIDSEIMQRLKTIQQLAMVDVVYPGATHTRFLHSLGVLHVCARMLAACDDTAKNFRRAAASVSDPLPLRIGAYPKLLARLVALLHDTAHVPFGHVFEREAHVFKLDEWEEPWRQEQVFGQDSALRTLVRSHFVDHFHRESSDYATLDQENAKAAADTLLNEVRDILRAKDDAKAVADPSVLMRVSDLRYPFVFDLVSNTLCADLVDYLKRDMFFCGLPGDIGTRCLDYLGILPVRRAHDSQEAWQPFRVDTSEPLEEPFAFAARHNDFHELCRVALLPYRYSNRAGAMHKRYVIVEAVEIVRRRKMLAEAAYFHKTKLCATSMLAAAVTEAGIKDGKNVWNLSDRDVINRLCEYAERQKPQNLETRRGRAAVRISRLAHKLRLRHLFTPIFCLHYHKRDNAAGKRLWNNVYPVFSSPQSRTELIDLLEQIIHVWISVHGNASDADRAFGSVAISCPHENMQLKALGMLVMNEPSGPLRTLEEAAESEWLKDEIAALEHGHRELWCLEVFVDPDIVPLESGLARILAGVVRWKADSLPNNVPRFKEAEVVTGESVLQQLKEEWLHAQLRKDGQFESVQLGQYDRVKVLTEARGESAEALLISAWQNEYAREFRNPA